MTVSPKLSVLIPIAMAVALAAAPVRADEPVPIPDEDRHAGYYYPNPSYEVYGARTDSLPNVDRAQRIGFVTGITNQMLARPFPPTAAIFAKGTEGEKLIITALEDGRIDTIYRARAILANMTAVARVLPIFEEMGVQDSFTFFELAKLLGFEQITITNGREFAHQIILQ